MEQENAIAGCLLGTAVGDALGLPFEGLSPQRLNKIAPRIDSHRFVFGKGMVSDDTEHACLVAQALIQSGGDEAIFARSLAWKLRFWLLGLPAGVGKATLQACLKLWFGFSPDRSGVFSAGNGAAMRSGILGVCYGGDRDKLQALVRCSTRLTHSDPKAEWGALAIAVAAYRTSCQTPLHPNSYLQELKAILPPEADEFFGLVAQACRSAADGETGEEFAASLGLSRGISGYVYHTVPVVLQVWLRYQQDYPRAIAQIIRLGGDTDTTAAILGGIIGASVGKAGIPSRWLDNLWEFPRTVRWIEHLGQRLSQAIATGSQQPAFPLPIYGVLPRNLLFLLIVLVHGFRRLLPPY